MKKMNLTTLVMGALISGSLADASGNIKLPPTNPDEIKLVTFNDVNAGAKLYIKDDEGDMHYFERIRKEGNYARSFDLSNLPDDAYYFEMNKANSIMILPFDVENDKITMKTNLKTEIAKPQLFPQRDKVFLKRDSEGMQKMTIEIYFEGRDLVYSNEVEKEGDLLQRFDFSKSAPGEYLFYIKYADRTFMEYVEM